MDGKIISLWADENIADEINRKKIVEIAIRKSNAKFKSFVKCNVIDGGENGKSYSEIVQGMISSSQDIDIKTVIKDMNDNRNSLVNKIEGMSDIYKGGINNFEVYAEKLDLVKELSYLNIGLTLANTAVSLIGFRVINNNIESLKNRIDIIGNNLDEKIGKINHKLDYLVGGLDSVRSIQKNGFLNRCYTILMKYTAMVARIEHNEYDLNDVEALIIEIRTYISEMLLNMQDGALEIGGCFELLYTIVPAYTLLLCEFIKRYYFKYSETPGNYASFIGVYEKFQEQEYLEKIRDYYMLEEKRMFLEVEKIMNVHKVIVTNEVIEITDQVNMLEIVGNKNCYDMLEEKIEKTACDEYNYYLQNIKKEVR